MMAPDHPFQEDMIIRFFGGDGPALDDVGIAAWIACAQPGDELVYHRGFLAVDTASVVSKLTVERRRILRRVAEAALRAEKQGLVHLVQSRLGPDQFAYIAIARPKPKLPGTLSARLLVAA
jgi:hypothetical protein